MCDIKKFEWRNDLTARDARNGNYRCMLNFDKHDKVSECKPPHCNLTVDICVQVIFRVRICNRVVVYVSWRKRVKRTQSYELYCLYFLPEVMVKSLRKARRHLVMLI